MFATGALADHYEFLTLKVVGSEISGGVESLEPSLDKRTRRFRRQKYNTGKCSCRVFLCHFCKRNIEKLANGERENRKDF